ncbi:MAG TPA: LysM domain-containing protein [Baekduia sp.]|nr:LysM domain-containing protein [Baekduia sp.]
MPRQPVRRSPARWLAPIALLAAVATVGYVVSGTLDSDDSKRTSTSVTRSVATQEVSNSSGPRFYVVKSGDVLSVIAEREGVSVDRIVALNPKVDPRALRPGTRLRLRR